MGGINHQPCGAYLRNSTRLSRQLSRAYGFLEESNVALEDVILGELNGVEGEMKFVVEGLMLSTREIQAARQVALDLKAQMRENNFVDLPTLETTDLQKLGRKLNAKKMVVDIAWITISAMMEHGGFNRVLDYFLSKINELEQQTVALREQVEALHIWEPGSRIVDIMEKNLTGNIKVAFAQLYTAWGIFHQEFLASSMLSTELWYTSRGNGSLVEIHNPVSVS